MKDFVMSMARGGKNDDDYSSYQPSNEEFDENEEAEESSDDSEEINFDKPGMGRDQIWNDYAEDLDFDD